MRRNSKTIAAVLSAAVTGVFAGTMSPSVVKAADIAWLGPVGTPIDFNTPVQWNGGVVPGSADQADINNGGTVLISGSDAVNVSEIWAGNSVNASNGNIVQTGGTVTGNWVVVGRFGATGDWNMSGGTITQNNNGGSELQLFGTRANGATTPNATMEIGTGAIVNTKGVFDIAEGGGNANYGNASVTVNGGTINASVDIWVGNSTNNVAGDGGTGVLTLNSGTINSASWLVVGRGGYTNGTLNINGGTLIHTGGTNANNSFEIGGYQSANVATLNLNGGTLQTNYIRTEDNGGTQTINFNGGILQSNNSDTGFIGGHGTFSTLEIQNGGLIFDSNGFSDGITEAITHGTGSNASDGGITKIGAGRLILSAVNTYTGTTNINGGTIQATTGTSLGVYPASPTNVIFMNNGQLINNGGTLTLNANRMISITNTGYLDPGYGPTGGITLNNAVNGTGNLAMVFDSGILLLNGSDTYAGSTTLGTLASGDYYASTGATPTLRLGNNSALPAGTGVTFGDETGYLSNSVTLDLNGFSASIGTLNGAANAKIDNLLNGSSGTLTFGNATGNSASITSSTTSVYAGTIQSSAGSVSLIKIGPGTQVFTGNMNYSGSTTVSAGKLYLNAPSTGVGALTVASGATLGGSGTISGPVSLVSGSSLEAGYLGVGNLSLTGVLTLPSGSNLVVGNVSNNAGTSAVAGITAGAVNFSGGSVNVSVTAATAGLANQSSYNIFSYASETGAVPAFALAGSLPSRATGVLSDVANGSGGTVVLTITGTDFIKWTGATNTNWDSNQADLNWKLNSNGQPTYYIDNPGDSVVFDDTAANTAVTVPAVVHPNSVVFNNTAKAYTLTGAGGIAGLTGVTVSGGGLATLDIANSYTGVTAIQNGTLQLGTGGTIAATSPVVLGNGTTSGVLELGDATGPVSLTLNSLTTSGTGTGNRVIGGGSAVSTLTLAQTAYTFSSLLGSGTAGTSTANALAIVLPGVGNYTFAGSNTYTGGTTLAGTLNVNNNGALGTGTIRYTGNTTLNPVGSLTLSNAFNLGTTSDFFNVSGNTLTLNGPITNTATDVNVIQPTGAGTLVLGGVLNVNGGNNDTNNQALYMATSGTTTSITGSGNLSGISMAWHTSTNTLLLNPLSTLTLTNTTTSLDVGQQSASSNGAVYQTGGNVVLNGQLSLGKWDGSFGAYQMSQGSLTVLGGVFSGGNGNGNGNSYFLQTGGTVAVSSFTTVGQGGSGTNVVYLNGGTYTNTNNGFILANGGGNTAIVTVAGASLAVNVGSIALTSAATGTSTSTTAILNLNPGGVITTNNIVVNQSAADTIVNLNGGTIVAGPQSNTFSSFLSGATSANLYSNGVTFNSAGQSIVVAQNLTSAGASAGINGAPTFTPVGSGYIAPPVVNVTGGGGTGATAVATINSAGQVNGIVMTSAGTGYTSTPTFTFTGGGGTGAAATPVAPTQNAADGGLTKIGTGNLTLSGSNSYTGGTQIKAGTLTVANNNALGTGNAVLFNGGTLAIGYVPPIIQFNSSAFTANKGTNSYTPVFAANGASVQMTNNTNSDDTSVFANTFYTINDSTGFAASFTYNHVTTAPNPAGNSTGPADGVTFTITGAGPNSVGITGGDLGYAGGAAGIQNSVAAGIEEFQNELETGINGNFNASMSTATAGQSNSVPFISLSSSSNVTIIYNGVTDTLTETITSNVNGSSATLITPNIDIAQILGNGSTPGTGYGFVGFTGSTGGFNDIQTISNFAFNPNGQTLSTAVAVTNNVVVAASAVGTVQLSGSPGYSSGSVGPLIINTGGTMVITSSNAGGATHGVLVTPSVTFNGSGGTVDITNNALDITAQAATPAQALATISAMVASGYHNGTWTGTGITSSTAAGNTSHLTAVGVIVNDNPLQTGTPLYGNNGAISSTFDGATPNDGDILVKYTYYGDANLDGAVDGTDYSLIDNTYQAEGFVKGVPTTNISGWYNGDFNYDGVVNGSDYTLMDNAFNQQGASFGVNPAAQLASATSLVGGSAVPEPTSLSLLAIGATALLGRRRRHH